MNRWFALVAWIIVSFAAAGIGSFLTSRSVREWYPGLRKPRGTPPAWVFAPVWSTLYGLMGIAAWLVWLHGGFGRPQSRSALWLFIAQLVLNAAWSGIFFALRRPRTALLEILLLWLLILASVVAFWRVHPAAGALLTPYLVWVSYAARLNAGIVRLNPHLRR